MAIIRLFKSLERLKDNRGIEIEPGTMFRHEGEDDSGNVFLGFTSSEFEHVEIAPDIFDLKFNLAALLES